MTTSSVLGGPVILNIALIATTAHLLLDLGDRRGLVMYSCAIVVHLAGRHFFTVPAGILVDHHRTCCSADALSNRLFFQSRVQRHRVRNLCSKPCPERKPMKSNLHDFGFVVDRP